MNHLNEVFTVHCRTTKQAHFSHIWLIKKHVRIKKARTFINYLDRSPSVIMFSCFFWISNVTVTTLFPLLNRLDYIIDLIQSLSIHISLAEAKWDVGVGLTRLGKAVSFISRFTLEQLSLSLELDIDVRIRTHAPVFIFFTIRRTRAKIQGCFIGRGTK